MTIRKRRGGRYYFRKWIRLPNGTKVRIFGVPGSFGLPNTRAGAEEALRRAVNEALEGKPLRPQPAPKATPAPTVEEVAKIFIAASETSNKHSAVKSKRQILRDHILPAMGALPITAVDYAIIEDFKNSVAQRVGAKTVNNILTVLRRMLVVASKRKLVPSVPEIEWLKVGEPDFDFLDFDEADRLIAAADREWRTMIVIAARTGMRQGELLGLRWEDADLVAGQVVVRQAIVRGLVTTPKNRKPREIPLSREALTALKVERHLRGPLVFCNDAGRALTNGACKHPLWRACRRAGLRRIGWHVLRHTFASHLVMLGVPLKVVQELMGHATIQMTMRYAHLAPVAKRDAVGLLDTVGHRVPDSGHARPGQRKTTEE